MGDRLFGCSRFRSKSGQGGSRGNTESLSRACGAGLRQSDQYRSHNHDDKGQNMLHLCVSVSGMSQTTKCSSARDATSTLAGTARLAGRSSSRKMARKLTPMGTMPHNQPSQGAGMAFDSILWAGGTSSLDQALT